MIREERNVRTHPQGLNDQVPCFQLSLHDAQQGEELWFAQTVHVELTFLKEHKTHRVIAGDNIMVKRVGKYIIVNKMAVYIVPLR